MCDLTRRLLNGRHDVIAGGLSKVSTRGVLRIGGRSFVCALGQGGRRARKREGDGGTPIGAWRARLVFYRADRGLRPLTRLPVRPIQPRDGWCDDPADRNYNRFIRHPYTASAERLWRDDALYDIVVVLNYNERPRRRGLGSAIFMHVARPDFAPTQGCIALQPRDLRLALGWLRPGARVRVVA